MLPTYIAHFSKTSASFKGSFLISMRTLGQGVCSYITTAAKFAAEDVSVRERKTDRERTEGALSFRLGHEVKVSGSYL